MSRRAIIIGGSGQIGLAVTRNLMAAGWDVTIAARGRRTLPGDLIGRGVDVVALDRERPGELARVLGGGADALIDIAAYGPSHGRQLRDVQGSVGALVVISSSSVYRDDAGRTLDEAVRTGFPVLPEPIAETQPTVEPGDATYSTRKVALERTLLDAATIPVTILRPAAIHGPGSIHPREWWFVKRMLDGRRRIPLAYQGRSRFHTSSVLNIAELARVALDRPATRILNIADPDAVSVGAIGAIIGRCMDYAGEFVPIGGDDFPSRIGRTPWSVQHPFVLDTRAAGELGYSPVTDYAGTAAAICAELAAAAAHGDWRDAFPGLAAYPRDLFDYAAEDMVLGAQRGLSGALSHR